MRSSFTNNSINCDWVELLLKGFGGSTIKSLKFECLPKLIEHRALIDAGEPVFRNRETGANRRKHDKYFDDEHFQFESVS
jgi:hypothetical protein